jgi:hypothetical protein
MRALSSKRILKKSIGSIAVDNTGWDSTQKNSIDGNTKTVRPILRIFDPELVKLLHLRSTRVNNRVQYTASSVINDSI